LNSSLRFVLHSRPSHLTWFDSISNISWIVQVMKHLQYIQYLYICYTWWTSTSDTDKLMLPYNCNLPTDTALVLILCSSNGHQLTCNNRKNHFGHVIYT
jgi:hypothetical protein